MPSHSAAQHKLMEIAAHTKGGFGEVPQKVGKEFVRADDSVYKKEFPFVQTDLEPEDIEDCMGLITDDGVLVDEYLSPNISITKDGYLWCENAVIARTGIQEYTDAELDMKSKSGKINLVRSKAEVFKPESLASFENKPITNRHPPEMVTSSNWSKYAKGSVHNVRQDGGLVRANLLITYARLLYSTFSPTYRWIFRVFLR